MAEMDRRSMLKQAAAVGLSALSAPAALLSTSRSQEQAKNKETSNLPDYTKDPRVQLHLSKVRAKKALITQGTNEATNAPVWEAMQQILNKVEPGPSIAVTGKYDAETYLKLTDFQESSKTDPDGVIGPLTLAKMDQKLYPREVVFEVQSALRTRLFSHLGVDGKFGRQTSYWLAIFQLQQGLEPTGDIDNITRLCLARPLPSKPLDYRKLPKTEQKGYLNGNPFYFTARRIGYYFMSEKTAQAYLKMTDAALKDGVHLEINSAFRTQEEQAALYADFQADLARSRKHGTKRREPNANRPGHSKHQSGIALDLKRGVEDSSRNWLRINARKFGFQAPHSHEPWHYELKK